MKKVKDLVGCPLCRSDKNPDILALNCGNFDGSSLYKTVRIVVCKKCGHVYNRLSSDEISSLMRYYDEEYAPANIGSINTTGDMPGSSNTNALGRYDNLYRLIKKHVTGESKVLDIGCAMGGFLEYLSAKGVKSLSGIDSTSRYIARAKQRGCANIKAGSAESIPFEDGRFDIVVMDQVLEHLVEPVRAFREVKRVLADGGVFCIGIPDASKYQRTYFFDFFWFLMREHVQHFDLEHLKLLAGSEGFELIGFSKSETPMMSEKMILPNLNALFYLTGKRIKKKNTQEIFKLRDTIEGYVAGELGRLKNKKVFVNKLAKSLRPVYVWGLGREFLYLYESAGLKKCNIAGLIDSNLFKQSNLTLAGIPIRAKTMVSEAAPDSVLVITAIAHADAIKKELKGLGYQGEIVIP